MVDKAGNVALLGCVDDGVRLKCHEIVMLIFLAGVLFRTPMKLPGVDHFADVFNNEISSVNSIDID